MASFEIPVDTWFGATAFIAIKQTANTTINRNTEMKLARLKC